jgi:SAM-dependent methyltransferase
MPTLLDGVWLERAVQRVLGALKRARPSGPASPGTETGPAPPERYEVNPFNLDAALRYAAIIDLLRERFTPELRILEVGSGAGGITEFLRFPVNGLDAAFDRTELNATPYLIRTPGRAEAMPFGDGAFDVALAAEVLEHIPAAEREPSLREMLRVLAPGGRLIVTFPADATARECDTRLNDAYRDRYGTDHPWVIEHLREGVPATDETKALLQRLAGPGATVSVHRHLHRNAWLFQQLVYSARRWFLITLPLGLQSRLGVRVVFTFLRRLNGEPAYRTILVADMPRLPAPPTVTASDARPEPQ